MKFFTKNPFFIALAINIIFLVLCLSIGFLHYGVKDDYFMAAVLTGAHGNAYNPHLYFVNALYGYGLIPLYKLFPKISWYYIGEMFEVFASFTIISYILLKKTGTQWGFIFSSLIVALLCSDFYLNVQFTQCAALLSVAGASGTLYGIIEKKNSALILGSILLFCGSLMRWEAFLMGIPFIFLAILTESKQIQPNRKKALIVFCALFVSILGAHVFDSTLYNSPEYEKYVEFQGPRAVFGDGKYYDKKAVYKDLERDGKSGENFLMLTNWKFYDTKLFQTDSLKQIIKYVDKHHFPFSTSKTINELRIALSNSIEKPECWAFLVLSILLLISNQSKKLYPLGSFFIILVLLSYLIYIHRLVPRVENGIWIYAGILTTPLLKKIKQIPVLPIALALFSIYVGCVISLKNDPTSSQFIKDVNKKYRSTYKKVAEYVKDNPNTIYFTNLVSYCAYDIQPPYKAVATGSLERVISYGYWTAYLPEIEENLKRHGIENPLKDVVKDNVIVIGDSELVPFLQRNYYDSVDVNLIHEIDNVKFYKYTIKTH